MGLWLDEYFLMNFGGLNYDVMMNFQVHDERRLRLYDAYP
jgi:hypothetical protein